MAISGRQRPSAGKGLRGHPQAGSVDPIAVVHPPVRGAGLESPPSCHVGSQLVLLDCLATEVDGVPVQSRPVIVGGQTEAKGAQHHWQPTYGFCYPDGRPTWAMLLRVLQESTQRHHRKVLDDEVDVLTTVIDGRTRQTWTRAQFPQRARSNERLLATPYDDHDKKPSYR